MSFNGLKRMRNINPENAFAYFASLNSDRRLGFRVYDDMLEEKYTYRLFKGTRNLNNLHWITSQDRLLFHTGNYLLMLDTPSKLNISVIIMESSMSLSYYLVGLE